MKYNFCTKFQSPLQYVIEERTRKYIRVWKRNVYWDTNVYTQITQSTEETNCIIKGCSAEEGQPPTPIYWKKTQARTSALPMTAGSASPWVQGGQGMDNTAHQAFSSCSLESSSGPWLDTNCCLIKKFSGHPSDNTHVTGFLWGSSKNLTWSFYKPSGTTQNERCFH